VSAHDRARAALDRPRASRVESEPSIAAHVSNEAHVRDLRTEAAAVAQLLADLAERLDPLQTVAWWALVRRGARLLVMLAADNERLREALHGPAPDDVSRCPQCAAPLVQSGRGRRRKFCSDSCRRNARNARNGAMDS
jgi:hypothetical protein